MCMFSTPDAPPPPEMPPERAAARLPDGETARSTAGRRTQDRVRAGTNTILTSGSGVTSSADTSKKTLLGG